MMNTPTRAFFFPFIMVFTLILMGCSEEEDDKKTTTTTTTTTSTTESPTTTLAATVRVTGLASNGSPVAGATVSYECADGQTGNVGATDSEGKFDVTIPKVDPSCIVSTTTDSGQTLQTIVQTETTESVANINPVTQVVTSSTIGSSTPRMGARSLASLNTITATQFQEEASKVVKQVFGDSVSTEGFLTGGNSEAAAMALLKTVQARSGIESPTKTITNANKTNKQFLGDIAFQAELAGNTAADNVNLASLQDGITANTNITSIQNFQSLLATKAGISSNRTGRVAATPAQENHARSLGAALATALTSSNANTSEASNVANKILDLLNTAVQQSTETDSELGLSAARKLAELTVSNVKAQNLKKADALKSNELSKNQTYAENMAKSLVEGVKSKLDTTGLNSDQKRSFQQNVIDGAADVVKKVASSELNSQDTNSQATNAIKVVATNATQVFGKLKTNISTADNLSDDSMSKKFASAAKTLGNNANEIRQEDSDLAFFDAEIEKLDLAFEKAEAQIAQLLEEKGVSEDDEEAYDAIFFSTLFAAFDATENASSNQFDTVIANVSNLVVDQLITTVQESDLDGFELEYLAETTVSAAVELVEEQEIDFASTVFSGAIAGLDIAQASKEKNALFDLLKNDFKTLLVTEGYEADYEDLMELLAENGLRGTSSVLILQTLLYMLNDTTITATEKTIYLENLFELMDYLVSTAFIAEFSTDGEGPTILQSLSTVAYTLKTSMQQTTDENKEEAFLVAGELINQTTASLTFEEYAEPLPGEKSGFVQSLEAAGQMAISVAPQGGDNAFLYFDQFLESSLDPSDPSDPSDSGELVFAIDETIFEDLNPSYQSIVIEKETLLETDEYLFEFFEDELEVVDEAPTDLDNLVTRTIFNNSGTVELTLLLDDLPADSNTTLNIYLNLLLTGCTVEEIRTGLIGSVFSEDNDGDFTITDDGDYVTAPLSYTSDQITQTLTVFQGLTCVEFYGSGVNTATLFEVGTGFDDAEAALQAAFAESKANVRNDLN